MDVAGATEPAFHRILAAVSPAATLEQARRLALFVRILALPTGPDTLRDGRRNLGDALLAAGVSEARVQMLMTARGDALGDRLLRTARRLVRDGMLPYEDFGRLILGSARIREETRFRIAKAYWAGAQRSEVGAEPATLPEPEPLSGPDA